MGQVGQSHQYLNLVDSLTLNPPYAIAGSRLQREPTYLNRYRADNEFYSHDLQTTIPSPLAYLHTACVPDLREYTVSFEEDIFPFLSLLAYLFLPKTHSYHFHRQKDLTRLVLWQ